MLRRPVGRLGHDLKPSSSKKKKKKSFEIFYTLFKPSTPAVYAVLTHCATPLLGVGGVRRGWFGARRLRLGRWEGWWWWWGGGGGGGGEVRELYH